MDVMSHVEAMDDAGSRRRAGNKNQGRYSVPKMNPIAKYFRSANIAGLHTVFRLVVLDQCDIMSTRTAK